MAKAHDIHVSDAIKSLTITVRVRGVAGFAFRLRIARVLLAFAAWVSPVRMVMEVDDQ